MVWISTRRIGMLIQVQAQCALKDYGKRACEGGSLRHNQDHVIPGQDPGAPGLALKSESPLFNRERARSVPCHSTWR